MTQEDPGEGRHVPLLESGDPLAVAVTAAIRGGDLPRLRDLLDAHPGLAATRIVGRGPAAGGRSLLHIATDWPGHYPDTAAVIRTLVAAGADPGARFVGAHAETPLHWAASNDDVAAVDALVAAGADVDAPGAVLGGGTPLTDACGFGQWRAARRLLALGARPDLQDAAALGRSTRSRSSSRPALAPRKSPAPSGRPATAVSCPRHAVCCPTERTSTGSATTGSPRSTSP
ncbi:ankyrin repeat domain-containing protein [Streptomyces sp. NPDC005533]|uniref:ankyrin repeat domain-containing protein n=1 Tax=Streptomyces sp. NPDC005533 TaxID=3364723 RepID=UPI00369B5B0B